MKQLILILSVSVFTFFSCSKKLDIQPTQSVDEETVFTTDANIKAALTGAYDILSSGELLGGDMQMYSELLGAGGEITWVGTYQQPREIFKKTMLTNNSFIRDTYTEGYRLINVCNNILAAIEVVKESDRDAIKGQALLMRGMAYFELVKLFSKPYSAGSAATNLGMQLVTTPTLKGQIGEANKTRRSSVEQTYQQILADLKTAKPLLGDNYGVYLGRYAASAILSRVYLQMGDYPNAALEASAVIQKSGASLTSTYSGEFNNTAASKEDIFVLPVTAQDGDNDMHLYWSISDYGARDGDIEINQAHLNLYPANDGRKALFYIDDQDVYRSGKWKLQYRFIPIIRLAEMYLTRAEANFRMGTFVGDIPGNDLNNVIRKRAGVSATTVSLANILYERHLELAHEGQRIHDIKRLKQSVDGFAFDDNKLVLPIPLREVNAGAGVLEQNPGYQ